MSLNELHALFWGATGGTADILISEQVDVCVNVGAAVLPDDASSMLIRSDYVWLYHRIQKMSEDSKTISAPPLRRGGVLVTGLSGIGKSYFILYALLRRLLARQDTAVYLKYETFYFCESGVVECGEDALGIVPSPDTWMLCDSNALQHMPIRAFLRLTRSNFLIHAASVTQESGRGWTKERNGHRLVMQPWTLEELQLVRSALFASRITEDRLQLMFETFGPSARVCFHTAFRPEQEQWERSMLLAAVNQVVGRIDTAMFSAMIYLPGQTLADKIFVPHRSDSGLPRVSFASKLVEKQVFQAAWSKDSVAVWQLYTYMMAHQSTKVSAGWLHEDLAHSTILASRTFVLHPLSLGAEQCTFTLRYAHALHEFAPDQLQTAVAQTDTYLCPKLQSPGGVQSLVIGSNGIVYLFRMTVFGSNSIHGSVLGDIRHACDSAHPLQRLQYRIVWIVSNDLKPDFATQAVEGGEQTWQDIPQYVASLDPAFR